MTRLLHGGTVGHGYAPDMTIAMRFTSALDEETARGPTAAELLPV